MVPLDVDFLAARDERGLLVRIDIRGMETEEDAKRLVDKVATLLCEHGSKIGICVVANEGMKSHER
jgi:hypothetical protein